MEDNNSYPDNKDIMINEKYMTKEDCFKEIIPADILVISNKYKKIV